MFYIWYSSYNSFPQYCVINCIYELGTTVNLQNHCVKQGCSFVPNVSEIYIKLAKVTSILTPFVSKLLSTLTLCLTYHIIQNIS
jgi:hypothetical protein